MDVMEGLIVALLLIILAVFGILIFGYLTSQRARLSAEMKRALDKSAAKYGIASIVLIGDRGIPVKTLKGDIKLIPGYTRNPETTLVRYQTGFWPLKKVRYVKLLREEHTDIAEGEPLYIAATSFLPLGNTGFEVTPNYPMGLAVQRHADETLPYALKDISDAYGAVAAKLIEINLTHQEAMERGGGIIKLMSNVKDTVSDAIPRPRKG